MAESIPRVWRNIAARYNLQGVKCEVCNQSFYPPRRICPNCRRKGKLVEQQMPSTGKIYSFTEVHSAPIGFELETPYFMAVIELENGVKILSQIVDSDSENIKIGAAVNAVFRRIASGESEAAIAYGCKFKVV